MTKNKYRLTVEIDSELIDRAIKLSGLNKKKKIIEEALKVYINELSKKELINMLGKVEFDITPEELIKEREREVGSA